MTFRKSYGGTGIVIPVKKTPYERKKQESGGFLQELPTYVQGDAEVGIGPPPPRPSRRRPDEEDPTSSHIRLDS